MCSLTYDLMITSSVYEVILCWKEGSINRFILRGGMTLGLNEVSWKISATLQQVAYGCWRNNTTLVLVKYRQGKRYWAYIYFSVLLKKIYTFQKELERIMCSKNILWSSQKTWNKAHSFCLFFYSNEIKQKLKEIWSYCLFSFI